MQIPPGIDADASLTAFRDWVVTGARSVNIGCEFSRKSNSSFAFHHLTAGEAQTITTGKWLKKTMEY